MSQNYMKHIKPHEPLPLMDDYQLERRIAELRPLIKKNNIIGGVWFVIGVIVTVFAATKIGAHGMFFFFLFGVAGAAFSVRANMFRNQLKCIISNNIVRGVLADKFELSVYSPADHICSDEIKETGLFPNWNFISGSDLVKGTYKGVPFSFSDVHLIRESGSGKNRSRTTVFKGQWLIIGMRKEIPRTVQLRERTGSGKKAKSDIETENIEFNRRYHITAGDPHTAFYVLTPHFMEYILKADKRAQANTYIHIGGRHIHAALHNGRDLFEPGGKQLFAAENVMTLRMQMGWDANYIKGIIDEFLHNEYLFDKENY